MSIKCILFEKGCGKWIRFHDTPEPQFHSNRDKATRIYEEGGVSERLFIKTVMENNLGYLSKTLEIHAILCDSDGNETYMERL